MEFSYEQNGRKILCSYWSAPFSFTQFEKACEVFDEIQIWYPIEVDDRIYEKYGNIISYIDLGGGWRGKGFSRQIDLTQSEEDIFKGFSKNSRYEIRRAKNRDKLTVEYFYEDTLNSDIIGKYVAFYNKFAAWKHLPMKGEEKFQALSKEGSYLVSVISSHDGEWLVVHGTMLAQNESIAALVSSSSLYRASKEHASVVSRANRYLHYQDMCFARKRGYRLYDVGGFYIKGAVNLGDGVDDSEFVSVSSFKEKLGGENVSFKTGYIFCVNEYKNVLNNLNKNKDLFRNKSIIIYGFGMWGKFIAKLLYKMFNILPSACIDNKLCFQYESIYDETVVDSFNPNKTIIIMSLDEANCKSILKRERFIPFVSLGHILCAKVNY